MGKVPLKTVLRNFLDHYNKLETSAREKIIAIKELKLSGGETPPPLSFYDQEYIKLKELTESLKNDSCYPMSEGQSDVNRKKNRYKDILPYDKSRVILSEYPGVPGSDYINANYVRGSSGNQRAYIASQGPLPNTLVDFWRMIWETEILVIVMACNEREAGKYKCEPYWPQNTDEKRQYGNITVEHVKWRQVCPDFLVRTFRVCSDNEERTICQFHYTTWPDHGVPISVNPILELVRLMRDVQSSESRPILVHCSAGCGRTGTICSIDYVWALLRTGKLRDDFSLFEIISDMRRQRTSMVQTVEQYILCYKAVSTLFEQHLKLIDTHTYANVNIDGEPLGIKDISASLEGDAASPALSERSSSLEMNHSNENVALPKQQQQQQQSRTDETGASLNSFLEIDKLSDANCPASANQVELSDAQNLDNPRSHSLLLANGEVRTEKVIGRATVIRRPSIAQLKAIFDAPPNTLNASRQQQSQQHLTSTAATRHSRLQRSQSIKEDIRNLNFNIQLEINQSQPQNKRSKSYTLSAAKLSVYKKHLSIGNLAFDDDRSITVDDRRDSSEERAALKTPNEFTTTTTMTSGAAAATTSAISVNRNSSNNKHIIDDNSLAAQRLANIKSAYLESASRAAASRRPLPPLQTDCGQRCHTSQSGIKPEQDAATLTTTTIAGCQNVSNFSTKMFDTKPKTYSPRSTIVSQQSSSAKCAAETRNSLDDASGPNAPPKPPRTYQHIMDDSCIVRTSEGRLIVTVAQPRQKNVESSFIPIGKNTNSQFGYMGTNPIYEPLAARKFHLSSPNLVSHEQVAHLMSATNAAAAAAAAAETCAKSIKVQPNIKSQYCDNTVNQSIYGNSITSKAFPRSSTIVPLLANVGNSQTPMPDANFAFVSNATQFPVDVFGNQHFQYHQAKPIILQQNFFEPVYGTTRPPPFLPPRPTNLITSQASIGCQAVPPRPRSISHGNFKPSPNHTSYDNIYANREMCFQVPGVSSCSKSFVANAAANTGAVSFAPIRIQAKENVYAEIGSLQAETASGNLPDQACNKSGTNGADKKLENKPKSSNSKSGETSSSSSGKAGAFSRIKTVFKVFRIRNSTSSKSTGSVNSIEAGNGVSDNANYNTSNNGKIANGTAINSVNGQPISRPPHSHRFQAPTQWTQV